MINVGFIINYRLAGWLGVTNYYRNFFNTIKSVKNPKINPIIITDEHFTKKEKKFFPGIKILKTNIVNRKNKLNRIINIILINFFGRNFFLDNYLKNKNIFIISHTNYLGKNSQIISLKWFPDFQEIHLPELFSFKQTLARSHDIKMASKHSSKIILSSKSVQRDLKKIDFKGYNKSIIFNHINKVIDPNKLESFKKIKSKYNIKKKFFFLPNHLWKHKNHITVLKALSHIGKKNINFEILVSGNTNDYRFPEHLKFLKNYIKEHNLEHVFRILKIVPFEHVLSLIKYSIGVINPSLCEGWSNTVDQANCYGKIILLSKINVHKEQNPDRGIFFKPYDYKDLSKKLINLSKKKINLNQEKKLLVKSYQKSQLTREAYAKKYENFILQINKKIRYEI